MNSAALQKAWRAGQELGQWAAVRSCGDRPLDKDHNDVRDQPPLSRRTMLPLDVLGAVLRLFCLKGIQDSNA